MCSTVLGPATIESSDDGSILIATNGKQGFAQPCMRAGPKALACVRTFVCCVFTKNTKVLRMLKGPELGQAPGYGQVAWTHPAREGMFYGAVGQCGAMWGDIRTVVGGC